MFKGLKTFFVGSVFLGIFLLPSNDHQVSARVADTRPYQRDGYYNRDGWNRRYDYSHDGWRDRGYWYGNYNGYPGYGYTDGYPAGGYVGGYVDGYPAGGYVDYSPQYGVGMGVGAGYYNPPVDGIFQYGQDQPLSPNTYNNQ